MELLHRITGRTRVSNLCFDTQISVTHGAVSQQICRLEAELGARLFQRRGNAMVPTPAAQRLARSVGEGMGLLHNAVAEFAAAAERDPLVLSLDSQFASRWLPSRLARLLADPPAPWSASSVEPARLFWPIRQ